MKKMFLFSSLLVGSAQQHLYSQTKFQQSDSLTNKVLIDEVITSATRIPELKSQSAASVTILNQKEIQQLLQINPDLTHILGSAVPGMALSSNTSSNRSQTLRGRNVLILVDGIPQSTPLRSTDRDIRSVDPEIIERIEIVKGSTSAYGNGAIGGLINIITKKNPTDNAFAGQTTIGFSDHRLFKNGRGAGYRFNQQFYGKVKKFNYLLNTTINQSGTAIDGEDQYISPRYGLGDTKTINTQLKLGYDIDSKQAIEAMYNFYSSKQNTDLIAQNGTYLISPTIGVPGTKHPDALDEGTHANHNYYLKYRLQEPWAKTSMEAMVYGQQLYSVFDYRENNPKTPRWQETGGQASIKAYKMGARISFNSHAQITKNWSISYNYGIDYLHDRTSQPLVDGRLWVPKLVANNIAEYIQQKSTFFESLIFKLGIRNDHIFVQVPDYSTIPKKANDPHTAIRGGKLAYQKVSFNTALSYTKLPLFQPYISYSEGFSIFDLGRTLRDAEADVLSKIQTEPVSTNNYEGGFNTHIGKYLKLSGAYFYSYAALGSDLVIKDGFWVVDRSPQEIKGMEFTLDAYINKYVSLSGSYTQMEGKKKSANSKDFDNYMSGLSIPANKLTAGITIQALKDFQVNLYSVHTAQRDRFKPQANKQGALTYKEGEGIVKATNLYNISASYRYQQAQFNLGIENLLNSSYYTTTSMLYARNAEYARANGRYINFSIRYKF